MNPHVATIGSVAFSRFSIQVALEYEFDTREIPGNFTTGYIPLGAMRPQDYPLNIYGSEVFELNLNLRSRAVYLAKLSPLNETVDVMSYSAKYGYEPTMKPPTIVECDTVCSDVYFSGTLLSDSFNNYTQLLTNGSSLYCMTAQEDNATLEAMTRAALAGVLDFSRIILSRVGSDFDRPPAGVSDYDHLFYGSTGGFDLSLENLFLAGNPVVEDILKYWTTTYEKGIAPGNYIGDILNTLDSPYGIPPDIG